MFKFQLKLLLGGIVPPANDIIILLEKIGGDYMRVSTGNEPLYKSLDSSQKIEFVLEQQSKGFNRKDIYKLLGYAKIKNLDEFMKNKGYEKENDLFVFSRGNKEESRGVQESKSIQNTDNNLEVSNGSQEGVVGHLSNLQDTNIQEKLINMLNKYEEYEEMLNWYKAKGSQIGDDVPVVEIVTGLEINYPKTTNMKTSIRLDTGIWSRFKKVADTKFSHVDNPSLLSQALYEFLEKYDK